MERKAKAIEYPAADGEPMAETGYHVKLIAYLICMLRAFFRNQTDVYAGGNMFMYYEEGDNTKRVAPDVFVAFGVIPNERRSWFVWEEGKAPDVVFEITSRGTRIEDQGIKKGLYESLEVKEYFLFDPLNEYLRPRLQGFRLVNGLYQPLPLVEEQLESEQLDLRLKAAIHMLDLFDRQTGRRLLPPMESAAALEQAETRMQETETRMREEVEARRAAEAEVARLREELARLRGQGA